MQTGAGSGEPRQLDALADPGPPDHINPSLLIKPAPGNCTLGQPQAVFSTTLVADRQAHTVCNSLHRGHHYTRPLQVQKRSLKYIKSEMREK